MKTRLYVTGVVAASVLCFLFFFNGSVLLAGDKSSGEITFDKDEFPVAFTVDFNDSSYAVCSNGCIKKFDTGGNLLHTWCDTSLYSPVMSAQIDVDSDGNIYVTGNDKPSYAQTIFKYDSKGTLIMKSPRRDLNEPWHLNTPGGIAVDSLGKIYVSIEDYSWVEKYTSAGKFVTSWGSLGNGDGQFVGPSSIAVDSQGNVYVADPINARIQKFDSKGKFITKWYLPQLSLVYVEVDRFFDIDVDTGNNVYAFIPIDDTKCEVQKFTATGSSIATWRFNNATVSKFSDAAVNPQGTAVYLSDPENARQILKFDISGTPASQEKIATQAGEGKSGPTQQIAGTSDEIFNVIEDSKGRTYTTASKKAREVLMSSPSGIACDSQGNIYVADPGNCEIKKVSPDGELIAQWGSCDYSNDGDGQFSGLADIAVDSKGNVNVLTYSVNELIRKYDSNGKYIRSWSIDLDDAERTEPTGLAVDLKGNLYFMCSKWKCVNKFDAKGKFIKKWKLVGPGDGEFTYPKSIAIDSQGNVYVTDVFGLCIQKFDSNGKFIAKWYPPGCSDIVGTAKAEAGVGETVPFFDMPDIRLSGIAIDSNDSAYVTDEAKACVYKFDSKGTCIATWGSKGTGDGKFGEPREITVDPKGNVYVLDYENTCVQKFDSNGKFIARWGAKGQILNLQK